MDNSNNSGYDKVDPDEIISKLKDLLLFLEKKAKGVKDEEKLKS